MTPRVRDDGCSYSSFDSRRESPASFGLRRLDHHRVGTRWRGPFDPTRAEPWRGRGGIGVLVSRKSHLRIAGRPSARSYRIVRALLDARVQSARVTGYTGGPTADTRIRLEYNLEMSRFYIANR